MNIEILPTEQDQAEQEPISQNSASQETVEQKLEEYLAEDKYDYQMPKRGAIHNGVVIEIGEHGAIVDAGFKRDGLVPIEDLERLDEETFSNIQAGDTILVSVEKPQDKDGRLILSVYHALVQEDWVKAEEMMENGEIYEGQISGHNRGGLLVPFGRIRGFVPASHIVGMPRGLQGEERRQRLAEMVGEEVGLKIIEVDRQRRRLIFSQRQARRVWQKMQRERVMDELSEGNTRHGTVTGITDFGAFVDLGGADGLIHISELSWRQVNDPREVVKIGDEVDVYILNLDWERKRIALSLKRLQPNPWTEVAERYKPDQLVEGEISRVLDFGAFVKLDLGVEGLLHVSEMSGMSQLNPSDIVRSGEKVLVKIISIDTQKERIALSARQVHRDEWERWMVEHKIAPPAEEKEAEVTEDVEEEAAVPDVEVTEEVEEEAAAPEAKATEDVEEEAAAPEVEVTEEVEQEATAPEAEVTEEVEEEATAPEAEVAEEVEEEAAVPEAEVTEEVEEETAVPEAEVTEEVEEEATAPEAEVTEEVEEEAAVPEAEVTEEVEEEATAPEAEVTEEVEEEATAPEAEVTEEVEEEAAAPEAEATEEENTGTML